MTISYDTVCFTLLISYGLLHKKYEGGIGMAFKEMEKICPICRKPNNVNMAKGTVGVKRWSIPKYILDLVPEDKKGRYVFAKIV